MRSSYIQNNLGKLIEEYVFAWGPATIVELGVLDGYSTLHIARGIERLKRLRGYTPKFEAYDLFDDYQYKHGNKEEIESILERNNVREYVDLKKGNAYEVHTNYKNVDNGERGIELLHVDISNTGKVVRDILDLWHTKISWRGLVLIEGGSDERDNIDWMVKYNMPSIKKEIIENPIIQKYYLYGTYLDFPSITVMLRKWWPV